jgi:hypothetical protein
VVIIRSPARRAISAGEGVGVGVGKGVGVGVGEGVDVGVDVGRGVDVGSGVDVPQLTTNRSPMPINKRLTCFIAIVPPEVGFCALFGHATRHLHLSVSIILQKRAMFNHYNLDLPNKATLSM